MQWVCVSAQTAAWKPAVWTTATLGNWKEGFCQFLIIWLYLLTELSFCKRGPTNLDLARKTRADDVLASPIHTIFTTYANDGASLKVCYMIGDTPNMNMCRHCICVYINICICACRQVCHAMGAPDASWARALTPEQDAPCCLSSPNTNYETKQKQIQIQKQLPAEPGHWLRSRMSPS